jgi:alkylation response protein AidB-like acyl-CoA dehydrogenase
MDFGLTKKQLSLKDAVREFCDREFNADLALELDRKEEFPINLYKKSAKHGFSCQFIPERYGGAGQGYLAACLAMEEMCRADSSLGLACMIGTFGSELILFNGTEEQKTEYLPPLCKGETVLAAAFTEPKRGTDITTVDTIATKQGDTWTINGTKTLITNAPIANNIIVYCQTDPTAEPRKGQTLFITDKNTHGLTVKKTSGKMGIRCVTTGEVTFKNVKVKDDNVLGEPNKGFSHAMHFFSTTRTLIAAQAVGTARGALETALKYAKKRKSAEKPIIRFQQIGAKIAQTATEIEAARLLTYKAASTIDQGTADPKLTSMAKLLASRTAVKAADTAIQTLGGHGYLAENRAERIYRDAKVTEIYEGTSEIQRLAILKQLILKS